MQLRRLTFLALIAAMSAVLITPVLITPALAVETATAPVTINEIHCHGNDWIELYNTSGKSFDLSGWGLSDKDPDTTSPRHRYIFPTQTVVGAKDYLVVEQKGLGDKQLTFGVSCAGGESIRLFKPITSATFETVSKIYVPKIAKKSTYGRLPNGTGAFQLTKSTKRRLNVALPSTSISSRNVTCRPQKMCAFHLAASNHGTFQIVSPAPSGAKIVAGRTLRFAKHKRGTYVFLLKLSSATGSEKVSLSVHVK